MVKLSFYVPESHLEQVKNALFSKGAGKIGDYDCCSWQVLGTGQFRPLDDSSPYLGERGRVEQVDEYKVEMVCEDGLIAQVVSELFRAHPYEEPAYDVVPVMEIGPES